MSNGCVSIAFLARQTDDPVENALIARWAQASDRLQANQQPNPSLSQRSLVGRSLIRAVVERVTGTNGRDCQILTEANGKPFVRLTTGECGPAVSVSHSSAMVVAAATTLGPLGVDVEFHRQNRSFDAIASFAFGPHERTAARKSPQAFYRIWCLREAMSKSDGRGLAEVTDRVDRVHGGPATGVWETKIESGRWLLGHIMPATDYSLAIAINCVELASAVEWTEKSLNVWDVSLMEAST